MSFVNIPRCLVAIGFLSCFCFASRAAAAGVCPIVPVAERTNCGSKGITRAECLLDEDCCWDDSKIGIWCFYNPDTCPAGFTYITAVKSCYAVVKDPLQWEVARIRCKSLNPEAHLLIVDGALEQISVTAFIKWVYTNTSDANPEFVWTAGQRFDPTSSSSAFVWRLSPDACSDSAVQEMTYTNWAPGEPNNREGLGESCVELRLLHDYAWNDNKCDTARASLCEINL